jgi:hypothetical protein
MDQRTQFIADYLRDVLSITELCTMYGVTRKTGYKWIDRYLRQGRPGWQSGRAGRDDRPTRRRKTSWLRFSRPDVITRAGAARSCWPCSASAIRGGPSRGARLRATF